jgi:hypothetical protein
MEGLLALSPYVNCPFNSRAKGVTESVAAAALSDLNKLANEPYMAYLKRKLWEWCHEATRPVHKQPVVGTDETAPAVHNPKEADQAYTPSEGGDGCGLAID